MSGAMYGRFKKTLGEVSKWAGPFGTEAAEGLRRLEAGTVDEDLVAAEKHLESAKFADAATSQKAIIAGLKALLARIEHAQGLTDTARSEAADRIREMISEQEHVREATRQSVLTDPVAERLVQQMLGLENIKEVIMFPRTPERLSP